MAGEIYVLWHEASIQVKRWVADEKNQGQKVQRIAKQKENAQLRCEKKNWRTKGR